MVTCIIDKIKVIKKGSTMKAIKLLNTILNDRCTTIHKVRQQALLTAVEAGVRHRRVSVTGLGRSLKSLSKTQTKHDIKRMDRLIGNSHLHQERIEIYSSYAHLLINGERYPVLLVDWSAIEGRENFQMLRAAIPMGGRALTIYEKTYPESKVGSAVAHQELLSALTEILPEDCQPILVTDAGFRAPWFRDIEAKGWYWLSRVLGRINLSLDGDNWGRPETFFSKATNNAQSLGEVLFTKSSHLRCQGTLYQEPMKGRQKRKKRGGKSNCAMSTKHRKKANEPWFLISHLPEHLKEPDIVVRLYKTRMQIEEGFRDTKNHQFGIGLSMARSTTAQRYDNLLLISSLILFVLWCIGKVAYQHGYHRLLQANTVSERAVLSYIYIAIQIIDDDRYPINNDYLRITMNSLNKMARIP